MDIVEHDQGAVAGHDDVLLDVIRAERVGVGGRFEGVLGQIARSTPVSDDERLGREQEGGQAEQAGDGGEGDRFHRAPRGGIRNDRLRARRRAGDRRR